MAMNENEQILQEIREIDTDGDYFPRDNESLDAFTARIDEVSRLMYDFAPVDEIAQCIINGRNDVAEVLYNASAIHVCDLDNYAVDNDYSLIEIAVRANNLEAVKMICRDYTFGSFSANYVELVLEIQPLYLAITLGFNEIAIYLYDIGSDSLFPGDLSTLSAIHMAIHYQNDALVAYFIEQFKQNHSDIVELLCA